MLTSIILTNTFASSFLWALVGLIVAAVLGYIIGNFNKKTEIVEKIETVEVETDTSHFEKQIKMLEKKLSNAEKNVDRTKRDKERISNKFDEKSEAYEALLKQFNLAKIEMEEKLASYNTLEKRKNQIETKFNTFKVEYDQLKKDILAERNEKNSLRNKANRALKELEDFRRRLIAEQKRNAQLQVKLEELEEIQKKLEDLRINYKVQSRKVKKLQSDCKYWEDQHFKTHHELTEQRDKYEELLDLNQERHLQILRMRDEKRSHLVMIDDYKSKFMTLHNQIHSNTK